MSFRQDNIKYEGKVWWDDNRFDYNIVLILSGIVSFLLYVLVIELVVSKSSKINSNEVEITLFTMLFQSIFYAFMMFVANIIYWLISKIEIYSNNRGLLKSRLKVFHYYYWFSFLLPFSIPTFLFFYYI